MKAEVHTRYETLLVKEMSLILAETSKKELLVCTKIEMALCLDSKTSFGKKTYLMQTIMKLCTSIKHILI